MPRTDPRLGWIPDKPDHRDRIFPLRVPVTKLPPRVDLAELYTVPVVDQGNLGSCTGNGIASALTYLQAKEGLLAPSYPSRLFIYYNERVMEGTVNEDAGAEIRDGIKSVVSQGFCPETDWPYEDILNRFKVEPSVIAYGNALKNLVQSYQRVPVDATSLMTALASGYPVIVGFTVYESFYDNADGTIEMPTGDEIGGHCVIVVGYDQVTRRFKFENSWGTGWGMAGFGTLPFEYLGDMRYGGDYWIVTGDQSVSPPAPNPTPQPSPLPSGGCLLSLILLPWWSILHLARQVACVFTTRFSY